MLRLTAMRVRVSPLAPIMGQPTPRSKFTDRFKLGNEVAVIRYEHGWFDGRISGEIISISDYCCSVKILPDEYLGGYNMEGFILSIDKPRDIHFIRDRPLRRYSNRASKKKKQTLWH